MTMYKTPFSRDYWRDAARELKSTRMLVLAALVVAVRVALKSLSIPVGDSLFITVGFFVNAVGSMVYGPVVALLSGAVCDILGCIFFPKGPYFFQFTVIEALGSFTYALFFYRAKIAPMRIFAAKLTVNTVLNIIINPLALSWVYGKTVMYYLVPRIAKNLLIFPLEAVLLMMFMGVMIPLLLKLRIPVPAAGELKLTRRHVIALAVMFVVAVAAVVVYYWVFYKPV
jgi:ECF transporter S component (folate family)